MNIMQMQTNHIENPLGFSVDPLTFSWKVESNAVSSVSARVQIAANAQFDEILFDSGFTVLDSAAYTPAFTPKPATRYDWRVTVQADNGEQASGCAWFETALSDSQWQAKWIEPAFDKSIHPLLRTDFVLSGEVASARAYVCGLGIYELLINGKKVGNEYLTPGFHSYDYWLQYQTYDITDALQAGENTVGAALGNGWYKGRFGFNNDMGEFYGDRFALICQLVVTYQDGSTQTICTDENWKSHASPVQFSGIYDGEVFDANKQVPHWADPACDLSDWTAVVLSQVSYAALTPRLSLPIVIKHTLKPIEVIHTPAGETVLDFGQNMTGWVTYRTDAPKGTSLRMQYGEILQNENFYNDNLRSAKSESTYISDGVERVVRPHFTFHGFRFVKLSGFDVVNPADFTACVLYSDLRASGTLTTSDERVNRLIQNAVWSQRDNFLDVPTDCPQRDERMGWTGDAQIFAGTACYQMNTAAFYTKYLRDLREEQIPLHGSVPHVVPQVKKDGIGCIGDGSCAWGDVAAVLPWTLYLHYGDKALLAKQFDTMKGWVDYIKSVDEKDGGHRLWQSGFHFADWLALDNYVDPENCIGGTDCYLIASAYYAYSAELTAKAAKALGREEDTLYYGTLSKEIKAAYTKEYFTATGRCAVDTQTALVVSLFMDLIPQEFRARSVKRLHEKLVENKMHLNTGFVGTPYLCRVLSDNGLVEDAYQLLMQDDFPSWLYEVKMGATTIWERWNSVLPDGSISGTGMNSLNHYAYGSIVEWMYRNVCGIVPTQAAFRKVLLKPQPNQKLAHAKASVDTPYGKLESGWEYQEEGVLYTFVVPFDTTATVVFPNSEKSMELTAGSYQFLVK